MLPSNNKINVLIFPAGEINSIELHDALSTCVNIRLVGASSVDRHGEFVFKNYISGLPKINEPDFIVALNKVVDESNIDVIIPTHDDVALFFAENKELINSTVLTPDEKTASICRDKKKIYELFADCTFCPTVFNDLTQLPVYIKPRKGQGGVGSMLILKTSEIPVNVDLSDYVLCEYLPGEEFTVDCFTDKNGCLQAILPRSRQRVFGGVSVRARNETLTADVIEIAGFINTRLKFLGLWYFQIKRDISGMFKLVEISTRCAGSMGVSRALGVNLPLLSVYAAIGRETVITSNDYSITVDRTLISRYKTDIRYNNVYIDFDDTIIVEGNVNLQAIRFLYQCVNEGKHVILITRHSADHNDTVYEALSRHKISSDLFDEIIELSFDTPKYTLIDPTNAIFIDNSFAERKSIKDNLGIPVFDVEGIEVLLDWRT